MSLAAILARVHDLLASHVTKQRLEVATSFHVELLVLTSLQRQAMRYLDSDLPAEGAVNLHILSVPFAGNICGSAGLLCTVEVITGAEAVSNVKGMGIVEGSGAAKGVAAVEDICSAVAVAAVVAIITVERIGNVVFIAAVIFIAFVRSIAAVNARKRAARTSNDVARANVLFCSSQHDDLVCTWHVACNNRTKAESATVGVGE